jgi:hypothetical protein
LFDNVSYFTDIYEKDYELLNNIVEYDYVTIITYKNEYLGHVYMYKDDDILYIIGIRKSLKFLLNENRNNKNKILISYIILDAIVKFARGEQFKIVAIENPIGKMVNLSKFFVFDDNAYFYVENFPNVEIPNYILNTT